MAIVLLQKPKEQQARTDVMLQAEGTSEPKMAEMNDCFWFGWLTVAATKKPRIDKDSTTHSSCWFTRKIDHPQYRPEQAETKLKKKTVSAAT